PASSLEFAKADGVASSAAAGPDRMHFLPVWVSCGLECRAEVLGRAFEIHDPTDQVRFLPYPGKPVATEAMPVLPLADGLLEQLQAPLRHALPGAAFAHPHASVGFAATAGLRDNVGLDAASEQRLEEVFVQEALVGAEGAGTVSKPPFRSRQQRQTAGLLRGRALKNLHAEAQQELV